MITETKGCKLTQDELAGLIAIYGAKLADCNFSDFEIERINYLNNRLRSFKEPDKEPEISADTDATNPANQQEKVAANPFNQETKSDTSAAGWGAKNA